MALFISFEGIEGCGKTTQIQLLNDRLVQEGFDVLLTREPGGTDLGLQIRQLLLQPESEAMAPLCELLLYGADRAQHVEEVIRPALSRGKIVLCDRYTDATTAYQEGGRELPSEWIDSINRLASFDLKPDFTFFIDCPVELSLERARTRVLQEKDTQDRFERLELLFHERVRQRYLRIAREEKNRMIVIDGAKSVAEVQEEIWNKLELFLKKTRV